LHCCRPALRTVLGCCDFPRAAQLTFKLLGDNKMIRGLLRSIIEAREVLSKVFPSLVKGVRCRHIDVCAHSLCGLVAVAASILAERLESHGLSVALGTHGFRACRDSAKGSKRRSRKQRQYCTFIDCTLANKQGSIRLQSYNHIDEATAIGTLYLAEDYMLNVIVKALPRDNGVVDSAHLTLLLRDRPRSTCEWLTPTLARLFSIGYDKSGIQVWDIMSSGIFTLVFNCFFCPL